MYLSFVREVPDYYFKTHYNLFKDNLYLTDPRELRTISDFINKFGIDEYRNIFNTIGIKYDTISNEGLSYTVDGKILYLSNLSSAERHMLYAMIVDKLQQPTIFLGLVDRLDKTHRDTLIEQLGDSKYIIVLAFEPSSLNSHLIKSGYYKQFGELMKGGII